MIPTDLSSSVLTFFLCHVVLYFYHWTTNCHKFSSLKEHTFTITLSVGQESKQGRIRFQVHSGCWENVFPRGYRLRALTYYWLGLAATCRSWRLPAAPCLTAFFVGMHNMTVCFFKASRSTCVSLLPHKRVLSDSVRFAKYSPFWLIKNQLIWDLNYICKIPSPLL